ncbi:MAG TPA: response regulator transcription factor [Candidatus Acidoferrales bacterium]
MQSMTAKTALGSSPKKYKVYVVDDHPIVRQGLALMINREVDMFVCGEAEEAHSALQAVTTVQPDVMIVDISLIGPDGIELVKSIRARNVSLPILMLSMHDESTYAERAIRAGANGYIMKQEATEKVLVAIRRILNGGVYLSDRIAGKMLQQYVRGATVVQHSPMADLSDRELEVFRLIGDGHGTRQIAEELHLSIKTVETYQAHIKEKLSLRNARELMQHAIEWNLTERPS